MVGGLTVVPLWRRRKDMYNYLALVPFVFFRKLHRRERAWLIGITAIYLIMR